MYFSGQSGVVRNGHIYNNVLLRSDSGVGDGHVLFWWCDKAVFANNTLYTAPGISPIGARILSFDQRGLYEQYHLQPPVLKRLY